MNMPPLEDRSSTPLFGIWLGVFLAATALFFLASLTSEADLLGSVIAGAIVAFVVMLVVVIVRAVKR